MNCFMAKFSSYIAWRYLFSKKGHNAINIITCISAVAVAVVTAAMVCVLSGMNGMGALAQKMFTAFDPPLLVVPAEGQTLRTDTTPIASLYAREDIECISMQLEQLTLVRYEDQQAPAHLLGVDSLFTRTAYIDSLIYEGRFCLWDGAHEGAVMGNEIAETFHLSTRFRHAIHLYAPKRTKRVNMNRPDLSINEEKAFVSGLYAGEQDGTVNQTIIVPIALAQRLYEYDEYTATALRIVPKDRTHTDRLKTQLSKALGPGYKVMDLYEQKASYFRIFHIEKMLTILLLAFIALIAIINIAGSLSMLIIDKREDSRILSHLGADEPTIRRIFTMEGWFATALGTAFGLIAGLILCLCQQQFGWLQLGNGSSYIVSAYPVQVRATDILLVAAIVLSIGFAAAWLTTRKSAVAVCFIAFATVFTACRPAPSPYRGLPSVYTTAYQHIHGQCYDSIPYAVVSLDLFSQGLDLNEDKMIVGTGYNLFFSDIFVPDSLLEEGEYTAITNDQSPVTDHSFLAGKSFEGYPTGAYILNIENGHVKQIQLIDSGNISYRNDSLLFTLYYKNIYGGKATYRCSFCGPLMPWQKQ